MPADRLTAAELQAIRERNGKKGSTCPAKVDHLLATIDHLEIKTSDSVRDLVGKVLRYLEDHPDDLRKLHTESAKKGGKKASPELMKALSILLGNKNEHL